ncbi:MAG TPA: hypothetical protein VGM65_03225 [Candidatus Udaeobacter sp.]|jgi:hypothetical protein
MDTYFIRHTADMDIDDDTRDYLWRERKIAIHFPWVKDGDNSKDTSSLNPEDYKSSDKRAIRALLRLPDTGGYVCAQHYPREECMLGFVKPQTKIELFRGKWGHRNKMARRTAVLKTLQLTKVRLVKPLDYAVLLVGRPRQGTIMRWPLARKVVENIVEGRATKLRLGDLSYRQQEILCSEFLRLDDAVSFSLPRLVHLLLPPGRTMRDIDITGLADDRKMILGQVTYSSLSAANWKIQRLLPYQDPDRVHLILFCACDAPTNQDGVIVFPIERAFTTFTASRLGKLWLRKRARLESA